MLGTPVSYFFSLGSGGSTGGISTNNGGSGSQGIIVIELYT